jgi:hypothetical protein
MEDLFDRATGLRMRSRIESVTADSPRQWGTMSAAQMLEHCARGLEMATGNRKLPRPMIGRILGPLVKPFALKEGTPMRRNSPTIPALVVTAELDLEASRTHLLSVFDRLLAEGAAACATHPHAFFGRLTPAQWSTLMYKHLDHHLRQFSS